jgi:outer membrane protein TolC
MSPLRGAVLVVLLSGAARGGTDDILVHRPQYAPMVQRAAARSLASSRSVASSPLASSTLTLEQARTLAVERSIALQQAFLESQSKQRVGDSYKIQQFPRVIGSGELSRRDDFAFSFSDVLGRTSTPGVGGGTGVDQFSRARDLGTWRYAMESRWSPTDALLAHYLMKNARNDATRERLLRLRVAQKLVSIVESSYWRLVALERARPLLDQLVSKREELHGESSTLYQERLTLVEDLHRVNQKLMQAQALKTQMASELELQREYLGSAMRVPPEVLATRVELVGRLAPPPPMEPVEKLESVALTHRPETYQAGLDHLNARNDVSRTNVKQFPKITAFGRYTKDIDRHLLFNDWSEYGGYVYFDAIDLAANRQERRAAKLKVDKTNKEIEAIALGVTTQVREAAVRYKAALADLETSNKLLASARNLADILTKRVELGAQNELTLVEGEGDVIQEELANLRALAEANARLAELRGAIGINYREALPRVEK